MPSPRNVVLIVVDSLRAAALAPGATCTPFFDELSRATTFFRNAYATECWTLPSHVSMFTGLLVILHEGNGPP